MAPVQLFPLGVKGVIMLPIWEPIQAKRGGRLTPPTRTPLASYGPTLSSQSESSWWPADARLAELSDCLGALAQPHRNTASRELLPTACANT